MKTTEQKNEKVQGRGQVKANTVISDGIYYFGQFLYGFTHAPVIIVKEAKRIVKQ